MSKMQREKGRKAEAEVRAIYEQHGFTVRGLEAAGDHLAIGHGLTIHSEVKRQEVLRLPLWARQALAEAPAGSLPIVSYRRNREQWRALVPDYQLAVALSPRRLLPLHEEAFRFYAGTIWAELPLADLLEALSS